MGSSSLDGTGNGWQGAADGSFTDAAVVRIAHAFARHCSTLSSDRKGTIAVAFDGRRTSRQSAALFADVLSSYAMDVLLSDDIVPTPVLSFAVTQRACSAGVMITAGSAPPSINGIRFIGARGAAFSPAEAGTIEPLLRDDAEAFTAVREKIRVVSFLPDYLVHLRSLVDFDLLRTFGEDPRKHAGVIIDSMGGAGQNLIEDLLTPCGWRAQTIFGTADAEFYDRIPEASAEHLEPLRYNVSVTDTLFGIATNGDASAFAIVYDDGEPMTSADVFRVVAWHLRAHKHWKGELPGVDPFAIGLFIAEALSVTGRPLREIAQSLR